MCQGTVEVVGQQPFGKKLLGFQLSKNIIVSEHQLIGNGSRSSASDVKET